MNLFDIAAGLVLLVSAIIGFSRGAVLELVTLFAFTLAAGLSVYLLPFTSPVAHHYVHAAWAANAVAVVAAFLVGYIALRMLGSSISKALRSQATLGTIDRAVGLGFGILRALVVLGVVYLVFSATPFGRPPPVMTSARLYPLSRMAGRTLASVAPGRLHDMMTFGRMLKDRATGAPEDASDGSDAERSDAPAYAPPTPPPEPPAAAAPPQRSLQIVTGEPSPPHHRHRRPRPSESVE